MVQSDFITPLTTGVSERSEQDQHTIISSLTSILVDQLAGKSKTMVVPQVLGVVPKN